MRRKADRLAGGTLKDPKARGEWAELYFMLLAAGHGMKVSRPFGVARYDVGVDHPTRPLRVQVKSTIHWRTGHGYSLKLVGSRRKKYEPGTVDFFAILLIPVDEWYLIPYEAIGEMHCSLHFSPRNRRQKYGKYPEAWQSLQGETGLTIQACCDEEWADPPDSPTLQNHPQSRTISLRSEWQSFSVPASSQLMRLREVAAPAVGDDQPCA